MIGARPSKASSGKTAVGAESKSSRVPRQHAWWCKSIGRLLNQLHVPDAGNPKEMLEEQSKTLSETGILFSALGVNSVGLILIDFGSQIGYLGNSTSALIMALYALWTTISLPRFRSKNAPLFIRVSLMILVAQGILWGALISQLSIVATPGQRNIVTAIIMALVSVPMLGAPFAAAMAFWIPIVIAAVIVVAFKLQPFDNYMLLCFGGYIIFTLGGIITINKTLIERSIGRVRLQQQNDMIGILLRDYEENTADWLWETDAEMNLHAVPARLAHLLSSSREMLEGKSLVAILGLYGSAHSSGKEFAALLKAQAAFRGFTLEVELQDGTHWWSLTGRPVMDSRARFQGYRGFGSDITEALLSEQRIHHLATHDSLTGLYNRSMFLERLERACKGALESSPENATFSLLLLDLDRFKEANDTYGHATGDALLVAVGERLRGAVRECDVVARLGGDEFAIYLPFGSVSYATDIAERLIALLSQSYQIGASYVTIGASFGIAMFPQDGTTPKDLLRNVDLALYAAKEHERGTYQLFKSQMSEVFFEQLALQSDLRQAIGTSQLHVEYQPIISLQTGRAVSFEALVRWTHPLRGPISPSVFIPLAEEAGMISTIGEFVLREACRVASSWADDICVAVNLSPIQFGNPDLLTVVSLALADSGLNPERLELEVTESTWLLATQQTVNQIGELERTGIRMVLDDFGTGYSSLACLREFRFHGIKIDRSFTKDLGHDKKADAIIATIARLASDIGVPLTAEGVETHEQLELLRRCGIDRVQGFLLGRPQLSDMTLTAMNCDNRHALVRT